MGSSIYYHATTVQVKKTWQYYRVVVCSKMGYSRVITRGLYSEVLQDAPGTPACSAQAVPEGEPPNEGGTDLHTTVWLRFCPTI